MKSFKQFISEDTYFREGEKYVCVVPCTIQGTTYDDQGRKKAHAHRVFGLPAGSVVKFGAEFFDYSSRRQMIILELVKHEELDELCMFRHFLSKDFFRAEKEANQMFFDNLKDSD